jgi:hypothetical protein
MKFLFRPLLCLVVFFCISSCSVEDNDKESVKETAAAQKIKKQQILAKFKEMGLDPKDVTFTDSLNNSSNKIVLNSINDLEKLFPEDQNSLNELKKIESKKYDNLLFDKNTLTASGDGSTGSWDYWDYYNNAEITKFEQQIPVRGALFDIYFSFWYYRLYMETTSTDGIKNAQAGLLGYVLGVSYEMIDVTYKRGAAPNYVRINGKLHYNIFLEGVGTVYTRRCDIFGYFTPFKNNNNVGQFICALGS